METTDKQFFLTFLGVSAALLVIAVVILVAANWVGAPAGDEQISSAQLDIFRQRIEPVGDVNLKSDPVSSVESALVKAPEQPADVAADTSGVETPAEAAPAAEKISGEQIYGGICQSCHATGVGGAPVVGDTVAWEERLAAGKDALYAAALQGKGIMPAKGGNPALSDAEVKAAVDYMIDHSR